MSPYTVVIPSALRLLLHVTPEEGRRSTAVAAWGASGAAAGALGFLVGGFLTDMWGWRSIYWVNLPIGMVLLVVIQRVVPPVPRQSRAAGIDAAGAFLLVLAIMAVVTGASMVERVELRGWGSSTVVLGILLSAAFVIQQRRAAQPLVPKGTFAAANLRTGTAVSIVNTATTSSAGVLVTLHLQRQAGASPLQAELSLMPFSLAVIAGSVLAKPLSARLAGHRLASLGLAGIAAGVLVLAATRGSQSGVLVGVVVAGIGLGVAAVAATSIGTAVPTPWPAAPQEFSTPEPSSAPR